MLKKIISLLGGRTPILYGGGSDKEQQFNYQYLAKEGYITLFPGDTLVCQITGRELKLPCQPIECVTEKGYNFVKEYESRWKTRIHWWCGIVIGLIGFLAAILTILSFVF